jgi:hypothetical protein
MNPLALLFLTAVAVACGGSEFTAGRDAGEGGTAGSADGKGGHSPSEAGGSSQEPKGDSGEANGGDVTGIGGESAAGQGGAGGEVMSEACVGLWNAYTTAFEKARLCSTTEEDPQCDATWVLPDRCGCKWPVNGSGDYYGTATEKLGLVTAANCPHDNCSAICARSDTPSCRASLSGSAVCQW